METRWIILLVLFVVRTVMGLQFQSVASLSPFFMADGYVFDGRRMPSFINALCRFLPQFAGSGGKAPRWIGKGQVLATGDSAGADSQSHLDAF